LKPGGVGVWVVNDATIDGSETLTSAKQKIYFREECGFKLWDTMIYQKTGLNYPDTDRYYQSFEYMLVLVKGEKPNSFNPLKDRENKTFGRNVSGTERKKSGITLKKPCYGNTTAKYGVRFNIWQIAHAKRNDLDIIHPASFPEKLAEDHILSWSNPGDVVLDPMCGSGTTCKMAVKHQRQYVGIDISEKYCELARTRLTRFMQQTTMFSQFSGEEDPTGQQTMLCSS
jgi:site-specific DNA-methyltransferase (adenine-specific)